MAYGGHPTPWGTGMAAGSTWALGLKDGLEHCPHFKTMTTGFTCPTALKIEIWELLNSITLAVSDNLFTIPKSVALLI